MDKRQSDNIEDRFRQAADNFTPPLNEEAWKRMEVLLDKDPKKRKPFIWWWMLGLLFLVTGSAVLYHYLHTGENKSLKKEAVIIQIDQKPMANHQKNHVTGEQQAVTTTPPEDRLVKENIKTARKDTGVDSTSNPIVQPDLKPLSGNRKKAHVVKPVVGKRYLTGARTIIYSRSKKDQYRDGRGEILKNTVQQNKMEIRDPAAADPVFSYQRAVYVLSVDVPDSVLKHPHNDLVLQDSLQQAINDAVRKAGKQEPQLKKWYLIAAVGRNATHLQKFGTKNIGTVTGGEIGYHVNLFLSIQAGFHAGKRLYFAGPADYKAKPGTYWSNPNIKIMKVDADCYIFDLPLSVRVDVLHSRHQALYATAGFSSFITKRENYVYHYSYSTAYRKSAASYKGNVDLFSSADFSIGFEQKLFKTFYLQAEPYARLPLSGIGEGKVKLYSLGIELGLKYQPLKRR